MATASPAPIGDNSDIDHAKLVTDRLAKDYASLQVLVTEQLEEARALPKQIDDDETLNTVTIVIRKIRDTVKRIESHHAAEKAPYLRGGQGCDQFFFGLWGKLIKRGKNDNNGAIDVLDTRVDDYLQRKLAEERRQRLMAEEQARIAAAALRKQQEEAAEAQRQAEITAARARKPENVEAHTAAAEQHETVALELENSARQAEQAASDAHLDAIAKPADLVRTRLEGGALATMAQVPFVQITDVTKLDKDLLWPFLKEEHIEMALKAWAKTKSHKTPMAGAVIEMRNKGRTR